MKVRMKTVLVHRNPQFYYIDSDAEGA